MRILQLYALLLALTACVGIDHPADSCPANTQPLPNCPPPSAIEDQVVSEWYEERTWLPADEWDEDPVAMGIEADIPIQPARLKLLGTGERDAVYSLAAKLKMIEQARYTVDAAYYIFKDDLVGKAFLGAMCDAVQRGVDVRLLVDSLGTISLDKNWLRALYHCQLSAPFITNAEGVTTNRRARVQVVIFNTLSNIFSNPNRRSHDKLLVVDGREPGLALVMTGGRNISLSYYGINADGSPNVDTYMDAELLLRPDPSAAEDMNVGLLAENYFSLLISFKDNRFIQGRVPPDRTTAYPRREREMKQALRQLKSIPAVAEAMEHIDSYLASGYHSGEALLAHEFGNLISKKPVADAVANMRRNPNSIIYLLTQQDGIDETHIKVVSPYLFAARYTDKDGNVLLDEAAEIKEWLEADPQRSYQVITNSVLTSDNFFAQSVVDMDMAPRLLLTEELTAQWQGDREAGELNRELVDSAEWRELTQHPRMNVYETGRLDDALLGGDVNYGKLHAKYMISDQIGFLGTSNFDYRSRLYNNEMGFFFRSESLTEDFLIDFERLKSQSYRWGSPEWLQMRQKVSEVGGIKGVSTRYQQFLYRMLRATGLDWQF